MIGFSAATEPLRMANIALGSERFRWRAFGFSMPQVRASNGVCVQVESVDADRGLPDDVDVLFVCGANPVPRRIEGGVLSFLKSWARAGKPLGGICTGSYWLAHAGLLDGYHCTLHWEDAERFMADFPGVVVSSHIFEIDRDRYTCSGGVAPVDMMLALIGQTGEGPGLVAEVAELLVCERIRDARSLQRVPLRLGSASARPRLMEAVSLMESNLEEPLTLDEIARYVSLSRRQLERLFTGHLGVTPASHYLQLRLQRARRLLLRTDSSIIDISAACGFATVSHFTCRYRECFGVSPGRERRGEDGASTSQKRRHHHKNARTT
ncbi:MAG: GlxA family transcriptional regulator [Lautropia sp.]|nr:GlxA family transcriptional regulator [Lautropia sp.]